MNVTTLTLHSQPRSKHENENEPRECPKTKTHFQKCGRVQGN